ncbi:hypothetical protein [Lacrimispora sphenoides]|uniref:hypothetical protein n=1 Tax=Lacrimispora sphenoides TaxID=29370 RepID=UPI0012FD9193|nr:hypothetical protein [Lacrimispora sphenoides]
MEFIRRRSNESEAVEFFGILLLGVSIMLFRYSWTEVGFSPENVLRTILLGAFLGAVVFTAGYGIEILIQSLTGNFSGLKFYVTSYSVLGNRGMQNTFFLS